MEKENIHSGFFLRVKHITFLCLVEWDTSQLLIFVLGVTLETPDPLFLCMVKLKLHLKQVALLWCQPVTMHDESLDYTERHSVFTPGWEENNKTCKQHNLLLNHKLSARKVRVLIFESIYT